MSKRKVWVVEEVDVNGQIGHRQSTAEIQDTEEGWEWVRPEDRIGEEGLVEWDRVLKMLKNVKGEDLRHLVCGVALMDHCHKKEEENKGKKDKKDKTKE